jgi:hypothetical protein
VPGIGAELARRIHEHLHIDTLEDLELAGPTTGACSRCRAWARGGRRRSGRAWPRS